MKIVVQNGALGESSIDIGECSKLNSNISRFWDL